MAGFIVELRGLVNCLTQLGTAKGVRSKRPRPTIECLCLGHVTRHMCTVGSGGLMQPLSLSTHSSRSRGLGLISGRILPAIPVVETGRDFPVQTLLQHKARTHALLDIASDRYPKRVLKSLDQVSRAWLARWDNAHLEEIDTVAKILDRPGAYFFSVNYEWGCTCRVAPSPDRTSARLIRVLDWLTPGLGENLIAARVSGAPAGPFVLLTWPG